MRKERITFGLPREIETMLLNGSSIQRCKKLLKEYAEYKDKTPKELQEILFTANTYLMAERTARDYEDSFEHYKVSPVTDEKTCEKCEKLSKMKFKFSERVPGQNFPPLHSGCRCSIVIVEPDSWNGWMDNYVDKHRKKNRQSVLKRFLKI